MKAIKILVLFLLLSFGISILGCVTPNPVPWNKRPLPDGLPWDARHGP